MSKRRDLIERLRDLADHIASTEALSDEDCDAFADDVVKLVQKLSVVSLRKQALVRTERRSNPTQPQAIEDEDSDTATTRPPPPK